MPVGFDAAIRGGSAPVDGFPEGPAAGLTGFADEPDCGVAFGDSTLEVEGTGAGDDGLAGSRSAIFELGSGLLLWEAPDLC